MSNLKKLQSTNFCTTTLVNYFHAPVYVACRLKYQPFKASDCMEAFMLHEYESFQSGALLLLNKA